MIDVKCVIAKNAQAQLLFSIVFVLNLAKLLEIIIS